MRKDNYQIRQEVFEEFSKKWNIPAENVKYVYWLADNQQINAGKIIKILVRFNIVVSSRQVKYFIRKVKFMERMGSNLPANYSDLMRKET